MSTPLFTRSELRELARIASHLETTLRAGLRPADKQLVRKQLEGLVMSGAMTRDVFGLNPLLRAFQTAQLAVDEISLQREGVLALLLYQAVRRGQATIEQMETMFGEGVARVIRGLVRIHELYKKDAAIETENFRNLLVSFAEDMRVILIMIADRVNVMRLIRDTTAKDAQLRVSQEAAYLYAPLAHKLGLYQLKRELEDLSLKYMEHDVYYMIKDKLNATKKSRDAYVESFIAPIQAKLDQMGFRYHIKGRTKSIHSIWQKMKKQHCDFEGVYDLFAIRIILDTPIDKEKMQCWQVFSVVTDMYQPNPKRLRDWLSVPKSNGYESLHITVLGPQHKWVEVQIRTERMDNVAEHGLAAHWRYKGVKSEGGIDDWLASIRSALEMGDDLQLMDQLSHDLSEDEIYVFTPKGDLLKFGPGATVLDFAYHIHSRVGNTCVGGRINGKAVSFRQHLHSGDTVEVITQSTQQPRREWLQIVVSSKAKNKIRLALKETQAKDALFAKELIERRFKNRKIELTESLMGQLIKKLGYKEVSDFYHDVAHDRLPMSTIIEQYVALQNPDTSQEKETVSAENFSLNMADDKAAKGSDVLVIDLGLKGIDYKLARCCHPIYGDDVFGFVTVSGGITIHRNDCPNAHELRSRFGYRVVKARWSGKGSSQYAITLRVVGNDDIGIVSNITNIISKDEKLVMRGINIDSRDGLFRGTITVQLDDTRRLETLLKKLRQVKGVKGVERL